ncbi:MAG: hypothetical protein K5771_08835 [Oscillospiraceae bacterium]|nr:hypothetical protein [Oscillospiraceae bacterium]
MDRKEKKEKKSFISQFIDLGTKWYNDEEIEDLFDLVSNKDDYDGQSREKRDTYTDWSSDGKYTRHSESLYKINNDEDKIRIDVESSYKDDDGQTGESKYSLRDGKEIVDIFRKVFKK